MIKQTYTDFPCHWVIWSTWPKPLVTSDPISQQPLTLHQSTLASKCSQNILNALQRQSPYTCCHLRLTLFLQISTGLIFSDCYGSNVVFPGFICWGPSVVAFGGGAFGEYLANKGEALMNGINPLQKWHETDDLILSLFHVRIQQEGRGPHQELNRAALWPWTSNLWY